MNLRFWVVVLGIVSAILGIAALYYAMHAGDVPMVDLKSKVDIFLRLLAWGIVAVYLKAKLIEWPESIFISLFILGSIFELSMIRGVFDLLIVISAIPLFFFKRNFPNTPMKFPGENQEND